MRQLTFLKGAYIVSYMADVRQFSTIFFDLDGTLLPLDEKQFMQEYLVRFLEKCRKELVDPRLAQQALMAGVEAMRRADDGGRGATEIVSGRPFSPISLSRKRTR